MRDTLGIFACGTILVAYALLGAALGWKGGGGLIPMLLLCCLLSVVWKGITGKKFRWGLWSSEPAQTDGTISVSCRECGEARRVKEADGGKRLKCPCCGTVNRVPASPPPLPIKRD